MNETRRSIVRTTSWPALACAALVLPACGPSLVQQAPDDHPRPQPTTATATRSADEALAEQQVEFDKARGAQSSEALDAFVQKYQDGNLVEEARRFSDDLRIRAADGLAQEEACQQTLGKCYSQPCRARLEGALRRVRFQQARQARTLGALEAFLSQYGEGEDVTEAQEQADFLRFDAAEAANTPDAFFKFLEAWPASTHADVARRRLSEAMYAAALRSHPEGKGGARIPSTWGGVWQKDDGKEKEYLIVAPSLVVWQFGRNPSPRDQSFMMGKCRLSPSQDAPIAKCPIDISYLQETAVTADPRKFPGEGKIYFRADSIELELALSAASEHRLSSQGGMVVTGPGQSFTMGGRGWKRAPESHRFVRTVRSATNAAASPR